MPIYMLSDSLAFPNPAGASPEGVVAVGGDFSPGRLLQAYQQGIFPWPTEGFPLLWFSPDPRFVLIPKHLHVSRSLRKTLKRGIFDFALDRDFEEVISACQRAYRPGQEGTWITDELLDGFMALHRQGYAHCVTAYREGRLVGGLYGVSLGGVFFGESMFALEKDASKAAFVTLVSQLKRWNFALIDCQVETEHLERFGAESWPRSDFLKALRSALSRPTRQGPWALEPEDHGKAESHGVESSVLP